MHDFRVVHLSVITHIFVVLYGMHQFLSIAIAHNLSEALQIQQDQNLGYPKSPKKVD